MSENIEEPNLYPVSKKDQLNLWTECIEDATKYTYERKGDGSLTLFIAQSLFSYRIQILSDRVLDHDLFEASDEELGLPVEDIDE